MAEFDAHFARFDFTSQRRIAVAVSGGSDSTGLLVLLREYLRGLPAAPELVGVTLDHGLRAESAQESEKVKALCASLAIQHVTKVWQGAKPSSGLQAAAREARYGLLAQAAREAGAGVALTGHTEDDQLETVFMRAARGEGPGLAGMAPATLAFNDHDLGPPVWFARPLLGARRAEVREALTKRRISWVDDPSNSNPDFERVAVRQKLAQADARTLDDLRTIQARWAEARSALSKRVAGMIGSFVSEPELGLLLISEEIARWPDREAAAEALRVCCALAGGSEKKIKPELAHELLERTACGEPFRATASRALLDRRREGLFIHRERRGVPMPETAKTNFDNRFVIPETLRAPPSEVRFARPALDTVNTSGAPDSLWRHARALNPLITGGRPDRPFARRLLNPWPLRAPLFDLPAVSAVARLTGLGAFPAPPCSL